MSVIYLDKKSRNDLELSILNFRHHHLDNMLIFYKRKWKIYEIVYLYYPEDISGIIQQYVDDIIKIHYSMGIFFEDNMLYYKFWFTSSSFINYERVYISHIYIRSLTKRIIYNAYDSEVENSTDLVYSQHKTYYNCSEEIENEYRMKNYNLITLFNHYMRKHYGKEHYINDPNDHLPENFYNKRCTDDGNSYTTVLYRNERKQSMVELTRRINRNRLFKNGIVIMKKCVDIIDRIIMPKLKNDTDIKKIIKTKEFIEARRIESQIYEDTLLARISECRANRKSKI